MSIRSCPARGMGVEIGRLYRKGKEEKSCPARGMGVEIRKRQGNSMMRLSCPARGMGVEIIFLGIFLAYV
mgnify:CR=1 FL=1